MNFLSPSSAAAAPSPPPAPPPPPSSSPYQVIIHITHACVLYETGQPSCLDASRLAAGGNKSNLKPVKSNLKPVKSNLKPVKSNLKPVKSNLKPVTCDLFYIRVTCNIRLLWLVTLSQHCCQYLRIAIARWMWKVRIDSTARSAAFLAAKLRALPLQSQQ